MGKKKETAKKETGKKSLDNAKSKVEAVYSHMTVTREFDKNEGAHRAYEVLAHLCKGGKYVDLREVYKGIGGESFYETHLAQRFFHFMLYKVSTTSEVYAHGVDGKIHFCRVDEKNPTKPLIMRMRNGEPRGHFAQRKGVTLRPVSVEEFRTACAYFIASLKAGK